MENARNYNRRTLAKKVHYGKIDSNPHNVIKQVSNELPINLNYNSNNTYKKVINLFSKSIKFAVKAIGISIVLVVLANFAPELKVELPYLYQVVYSILHGFEFLAQKAVEFLPFF